VAHASAGLPGLPSQDWDDGNDQTGHWYSLRVCPVPGFVCFHHIIRGFTPGGGRASNLASDVLALMPVIILFLSLKYNQTC
jgi:hypothetical protein